MVISVLGLIEKIEEQITDNTFIELRLREIKFRDIFGYRPFNRKSLKWSDEQLKLKNKIKKQKYKPKKYGYPRISKDNVCIDGHHRIIILRELYGENYRLKVYKNKYGWHKNLILTIILSLISKDY